MALPRRRAGFTLVELIVVTLISGLMFVSLAAFYASGIRFQIQTFSRLVIQNRALFTIKALQSTADQATIILAPPKNTAFTNVFRGGINVRPDDGTPLAPIPYPADPTFRLFGCGPGDTRASFHFCVTNNCPPSSGVTPVSPNCLWFYRYCTYPPPAVNCGITPAPLPPAGAEVIASPLPATSALPFSRPLSPTNLIRVNLELFKPASGQSQEARAKVQVDLTPRLATQE